VDTILLTPAPADKMTSPAAYVFRHGLPDGPFAESRGPLSTHSGKRRFSDADVRLLQFG